MDVQCRVPWYLTNSLHLVQQHCEMTFRPPLGGTFLCRARLCWQHGTMDNYLVYWCATHIYIHINLHIYNYIYSAHINMAMYIYIYTYKYFCVCVCTAFFYFALPLVRGSRIGCWGWIRPRWLEKPALPEWDRSGCPAWPGKWRALKSNSIAAARCL